jgi:hypothetical protein
MDGKTLAQFQMTWAEMTQGLPGQLRMLARIIGLGSVASLI